MPDPETPRIVHRQFRLRWRVMALLGTLLLITLIGMAAGMYFAWYNRPEQVWVFAAGAVLFGALLMVAAGAGLDHLVLRPIERLRAGAERIARGDFSQRVPGERRDEIGEVAAAFNRMSGELETLYGRLEQQVAERTHDLERRSAYLRTAADVGRSASSILEIDRLVWHVVDLILNRFGMYHVGLFYVDETGKWAVYRAGAGAGGRELAEQGFRLEVGGPSLVGWCMAHGQARVVQDASQETDRVDHALVPNTLSEAALPVSVRGRVAGALSVQSDRPAAFNADVVAALQIIADQVAVALDNARLFAEHQEALQATRRAYSELSQQAWVALLRGRGGWGYRYSSGSIGPLAGEARPEMVQARESGHIVESTAADDPFLAIPILVRDQVVGVLGFQKKGQSWTADERRLVTGLSDQVGAALESARLYDDVQRRAARERLSAQVTARMRETLDVETVLKTAIREMGTMLGLPRVEVRMVGALPPEGDEGIAAQGRGSPGGNGHADSPGEEA